MNKEAFVITTSGATVRLVELGKLSCVVVDPKLLTIQCLPIDEVLLIARVKEQRHWKSNGIQHREMCLNCGFPFAGFHDHEDAGRCRNQNKRV